MSDKSLQESKNSGGWRYQPVYVDYPDGRIFSLCEVGVSEDGALRWWTEDPAMVPQGETIESAAKDLARMMAALWKWKPVAFNSLVVGMKFQKTGVDVENMIGAMELARKMDMMAEINAAADRALAEIAND
jgi:hypothetical protein